METNKSLRVVLGYNEGPHPSFASVLPFSSILFVASAPLILLLNPGTLSALFLGVGNANCRLVVSEKAVCLLASLESHALHYRIRPCAIRIKSIPITKLSI